MRSQRDVPVKDLVSVFTCKHCSKVSRRFARGLCWTCYYRAGVLGLYPLPDKMYNYSGVRDYYGRSREGQPTEHLPGSAGKLSVLEERAQNGQALFHRWDAETPL